MKPLTSFEKMRMNTKRRAEVRNRLISEAIQQESFRIEMEALDKTAKRLKEQMAKAQNDPNANPYVEAPKLGSWWPF